MINNTQNQNVTAPFDTRLQDVKDDEIIIIYDAKFFIEKENKIPEIQKKLNEYEFTSIEDMDILRKSQKAIYGKRFMFPGGRSVLIGCDKSVQEAININRETWDLERKINEELSWKLVRANQEKKKIEMRYLSASSELRSLKCKQFWSRICWAFKALKKGGYCENY